MAGKIFKAITTEYGYTHPTHRFEIALWMDRPMDAEDTETMMGGRYTLAVEAGTAIQAHQNGEFTVGEQRFYGAKYAFMFCVPDGQQEGESWDAAHDRAVREFTESGEEDKLDTYNMKHYGRIF